MKVEAKSILMKLISVMEGQMVGRGLMERGRWIIQPEAILMGIKVKGVRQTLGSGENLAGCDM